jgi:hypothetical protein
MSEPEVIPPERIGKVLRERKWDESRLGTQTFAVVCPLCGAMVAIGAPPNSVTYQESHIRHHEWETER